MNTIIETAAKVAFDLMQGTAVLVYVDKETKTINYLEFSVEQAKMIHQTIEEAVAGDVEE